MTKLAAFLTLFLAVQGFGMPVAKAALVPWAATWITLAPGRTSTERACHVCDEEQPASTVTPMVVAVSTPPPAPTSPPPVVRGVLFWSKTCPHCHDVIDNVLPPIQNKYGDRLDIRLFELSVPSNAQLFEAALEAFRVPLERAGVPFLIVGETVLVGSGEIPQQLPALIDKHLAAGGIGWPHLSGLEQVFQAQVSATVTVAVTLVQQPIAAAAVSPIPQPTPTAGMVAQATPVRLASIPPTPVSPSQPVVRAVMYWMDGCPHCEQVLTRVLPPLQEKYGDQFEIRLVQVATPQEIDDLYTMAATFGLSKEQTGVPFLLIANQALVGSEQIPAELPGLIDRYLATGGTEWPARANLAPITVPPTTSPICAPTTTDCGAETAAAELPVQTILRTDPAGFGLAIAVMLGMIGALLWSSKDLLTRRPETAVFSAAWTTWMVPLLVVLGLGVAGYLAYVETLQVSAICGPIGHCNTVQQSPYARLFGVLPIGVLGALGYLAILGTWFIGQVGSARYAGWGRWSALAMAVFGVLFSLYLTLLEPFVIGAVCAWCLTSAVIMTALMVLLTRPALQLLSNEHP